MKRIRLSDRYDLVDRHPERGAPSCQDWLDIVEWLREHRPDQRPARRPVGPSEVKGSGG